jgi:putative nucleotidyltransferase with HDIG domain
MLSHSLLVQSAYQLEPLPPSLSRLAALMAQEDPDPGEITEVLSFDPVITAKLLRVANSASSAPERPITRVRDAVIRMGPGLVFSLAVGFAARPLMTKHIPGYELSPGELWRHSVLTALAAESACGVCSTHIPAEAFAAALLHDMGKLILGRFLTAETCAMLRRAVEEGGVETSQAEVEILSLHHGEVGAVIAQHWQLPDGIAQGIHYHHDPQVGGQTICYVTYLADVVAKSIAAGAPLPERDRKHLDATMAVLGLTPEGFEKLQTTVTVNFERMGARYN